LDRAVGVNPGFFSPLLDALGALEVLSPQHQTAVYCQCMKRADKKVVIIDPQVRDQLNAL
jgi:hypothetical protein